MQAIKETIENNKICTKNISAKCIGAGEKTKFMRNRNTCRECYNERLKIYNKQNKVKIALLNKKNRYKHKLIKGLEKLATEHEPFLDLIDKIAEIKFGIIN